MDTDVNLCKIDDVPDGGKKHFEIMGYDILVVRLGDQMVGQPATVIEGLRPGEKGYVRHRGELWQATADETLSAESRVYIQGVDGIVLRVSSTPPPAPASNLLRRRFAFLLRRKAA